MSLNLATLLRESAKKHPAKPAIHINDVTIPYGMLDGMAQKFAGALQPQNTVATAMARQPKAQPNMSTQPRWKKMSMKASALK